MLTPICSFLAVSFRHYVATIQDSDAGSVLFNDEKVVKSEGAAHESLKELAYLYVFEKI